MIDTPTFQTLCADDCIDRHQHRCGYVALVLSGRYLEAGARGRFEVGPGQVVFHGAWEAHRNTVSSSGAKVLNLQITTEVGANVYLCLDPDGVARAAERDKREALARLHANLKPVMDPLLDWPDVLASALRRDPSICLSDWANAEGLNPCTISRGFANAYGVSPRGFRAEQRALKAAELLRDSDEALAAIAIEAGFSDQAHMTRAVSKLTGLPPSRLRSSRCNPKARSPASLT